MRFDHHFLKLTVPELEFINSSFPVDYFFSIDSRTLRPGEIFIALPGDHVDGHDFIAHAFEKGAAGVVIAAHKKGVIKAIAPELLKNKLIIAVPDTHQALLSWAHSWREQFSIPIIGITGSVGKTSTKELLSTILTAGNICHLSSANNQNTLIGAALNMLHLRDYHAVAIFEMGINQRGEMAALANLVKPTLALITTIGHCHMEGLGSLNDIALEKRDIFKFFTEKSIGIINGDIGLLSQVSYIHPVIKFGSKTINQIQARKIQMSDKQTNFVMKVYKNKYQICLPQAHVGAVSNALAATALAHMLDIPMDTIVRAIQTPLKISGRFEEKPLKNGKGIVINDCYNANPESMKAALLAFEKYETSLQKIAILGDMLELGINSPFWHRQLGRFLRKVPSLKRVILVGDLVQWTKKTVPVTLPVELVATWQEAAEKAKMIMADTGSVVLVKASQGMKLSLLVDELVASGQVSGQAAVYTQNNNSVSLING